MKIELSNFKVYGYLNIEHGARSGCVYLSLKPKGYWSEVIEVYIRRDLSSYDASPREYHTVWQTSIKVASGGRNDEVSCDIEAAGYFMEALAFARTFADTVDYAALESAYREERDRRREEYEAKRVKT